MTMGERLLRRGLLAMTMGERLLRRGLLAMTMGMRLLRRGLLAMTMGMRLLRRGLLAMTVHIQVLTPTRRHCEESPTKQSRISPNALSPDLRNAVPRGCLPVVSRCDSTLCRIMPLRSRVKTDHPQSGHALNACWPPRGGPENPRCAAVQTKAPRNRALVNVAQTGADVKRKMRNAKRSFAGRCVPKQELGRERTEEDGRGRKRTKRSF